MPSSTRSRPERRAARGGMLTAVALLALAPLSTRAAPAESRAPPAANPKTQAEARAKFAEGNTAYEQAQYQKALEAYLEAYRLLPLPGFLFNIAQCHRQLGQPESAASHYRRYLSQSKQPPANAPLVRELIAEMDAAVAKEKTQEPPKGSGLRKQTTEIAERRAREEGEHARTVAPKAAPAEVQGESLAKKWWVWAGAGIVAVAAGGIVYAATAPQPRPATLGTIR